MVRLMESLHDGHKRRGSSSVEKAPAKKPALEASSHEKTIALCDRCRQINWQDLAATSPKSRVGRRVADLSLEDHDALARAACVICRLLARVLPRHLSGRPCCLVALSSSYAILGEKPDSKKPKRHSDCTVLFAVSADKLADKTASQRIGQDWYEGGCLALFQADSLAVVDYGDETVLPEIGPRRIHSTAIDYRWIDEWLCHCRVHHHQTCQMVRSPVRGLRVIDCASRTTIDAPKGCEYFALSYVWGRAPPPSLSQGGDCAASSQAFPAVVEDAINVTLSLHGRYLWVDQFCIDQNDESKKAEQIAQMDKIYSQAYLTIVAAAGHDSSYGLPGVSSRLRRAQGRCVVNAVAFVQIFPHTSASLSASKWASRGWTYQEGYLSPRRLIFTDDQVSYLCNTTHHAESVRKPLKLSRVLNEIDNARFLGMIPATSSQGSTNSAHRWLTLTERQLVNYTKRELTYPDDSLNAVLGLFGVLEQHGIRQIHGMPLLLREMRPSILAFPLAWYHEVAGARRCQFPSWSWAGWQGGIRMDEPEICIPRDCEVELVGDEGRIVSLPDWLDQEERDPNASNTTSLRLLRITALAVSLEFEERSWIDLKENRSQSSQIYGKEYVDGLHAVLPIREGITAMACAYLDNKDEPLPLNNDVLGLVLRPRHPVAEPSRKSHTVLLVRRKGQHYQRIGLVRVSHSKWTVPPFDFSPQTIYLDGKGTILEAITQEDRCPLWLRDATERTITIM